MMAFRSSARQIGIELGLDLCLRSSKMSIELLHLDVQRDFAEHLDEAAVAIVGEARVAGLRDQALDGLVVQAEVEDGVHHARHGELRAGAHAQQQRVRRHRRASCPCALRASSSAFQHLLVDFGGNLLIVVEVDVADFGGDREAGRHRHAGLAHLGQAGAFAAERVFHVPVAVGRSAAERVDIFLMPLMMSPASTCSRDDFRKIRNGGKFGQQAVQQRQPVLPDAFVRRIHQHLVEEQIDFGAQRRDRFSAV